MQRTNLFEAPVGGNLLFSLKDIAVTPVVPKMNEPVTITGKVNLFSIPFLAPVWVIVTATYPSTWWEEIFPIIGSPEVRESSMVVGSDFEITFKKGFLREGEFDLSVRVYPGPTFPLDSIVFPPAPAFATEDTTFMVAGEAPPAGFSGLSILSYSKNGGPPVTPSGVLELEVGDMCRVNFSFEHRGDAETGRLYAAIGNYGAAGFDEIIANDKSISVPSSTDWEPFEGYVDIPITTAISPGSGYDLYGKIVDIPGADIFSSYLEDVITITGVPVEGVFENLRIISYETDLPIGGTCHVVTKFEYQGPILTRNLYAAIGNNGAGGFDEICKGQKSKTVGPDDTPKTYEDEVAIPITSAIDPAGSPYDLYAKVCHGVACGMVDALSPYLEEVITILGPPVNPQFRNLEVTDYDTPLEAGDTCNVRVSFDYQGPSTSKLLYAAIGIAGATFDEKAPGSKTISIPQTESWSSYEKTVSISIGTKLPPEGSPYDLYAKIDGFPPTIISPYLHNVIEISGPPTQPQFANLEIIDYDTPLEAGDTCGLRVRFDYQGPSTSKLLYAAIGNAGATFDEVVKGSKTISVPATESWSSYEKTVSISIGTKLAPEDSPYDLYAKIDGVPPTIISPYLEGVIEVTGPPTQSEFTDLRIYSYTSKVKVGGTCNVTVKFEHRGPSHSREIYAALGNLGWGGFDEILSTRKSYSISASADWRTHTVSIPISITSAISPGTYTIYSKICAGPTCRFLDIPIIEAPYAELAVTVEPEVPVGIDFEMAIWGAPDDFPLYDYWQCWYWDNGIGGYVSDKKWYRPYQKIQFTNIKSGDNGYVAVFLRKNSTVSSQYTGPRFDAVDGGSYKYDVDINHIY